MDNFISSKEALLSEESICNFWSLRSILVKSLNGAKHYSFSYTFNCSDNDACLKEIQDLKLKEYYETYPSGKTYADFEEGYVVEVGNASSEFSLFVCCSNPALFAKLKEILLKYKIALAKSDKGTVYVLTSTKQGFDAKYLCEDYVPLNRDNYDPSVLSVFDKTVTEFNLPNPSGFISIFSGPPGTGKTFLLRALLGSIKNSLFLFVPPDMVRSIAGPNLIPTFIQLKNDLREEDEEMLFDTFDVQQDKERRVTAQSQIVLILEDADEVIAPRNETDVAQISSILNLTDGILGKSLNMRILATTNSSAKSFDAAIMRPGRLCGHASVDKLNLIQCKKILTRLYSEKRIAMTDQEIDTVLEGKSHSLAELYNILHGYKEVKNQRKVGF